jgi:TolB-like protein
MASIIPGFEYDIFISYRQKDNKGDRWVSEFIEALKTELESTFKEDISVYFDINPHDGLLETHDVSASLKEKLKCLVFIPIISQTFCDSKSFAWQHEFCAFNKLSKEDQFGRDIRLAGGNVASRILPIKINDLDPEDKTLLENELGGVLRSIEFIYKASGVNRALKPNDERAENLNHTYYRDQINKVANAVKEIITALKKNTQQDGEVSREVIHTKPEKPKNQKARIGIVSILALALIIPGYFFIPKLFKPAGTIEKSIAVLPFINDSHDSTNVYFINGLMEGILDNLAKIKDLKVMSRTSVEQYRNNKTKTLPQIAKELGVNYIVEGSGQKYGDQVMLSIQLLEAGSDKHLFSERYNREWKDIFSIQSEIAKLVAASVSAAITPEEIELIQKKPTENIVALNMFLRGKDLFCLTEIETNFDLNRKAQNYFKKAIQLDSSYADPYVYLGWLVNMSTNNYDSVLYLANRALHFDNRHAGAYHQKGWYYLWHSTGMDKEAEEAYHLAILYNPNNSIGYAGMGDVFWKKMDYLKTIEYKLKALKLEKDPQQRNVVLKFLCYELYQLGFYKEGLKFASEIIEIDNDSLVFYQGLIAAEMYKGNYLEAFKNLKHTPVDDDTPDVFWTKGNICVHLKDYKGAQKFVDDYTSMIEKKGGKVTPNLTLGFIYLKNGQKEKAAFNFESLIKYLKIIIAQDLPGSRCMSYLYMAYVYSAMGEKAKAIENLRKVLEYRDEINLTPFFITECRNNPIYDLIRDTPELQEILKIAEERFPPVKKKIETLLREEGISE